MNSTNGDIRGPSPLQTGSDKSLVGVLGFDFQLFLTSFTNPVVFAVDEGVVMNPLAVVFRTLHTKPSLAQFT